MNGSEALKKITVSACALFIMLGFIAGGIAQLRDAEDKKTEEQESITTATEPQNFFEKNTYVLKIEDGIVVVFNETDMTRPIIVTDIYASTLRNFDRIQLTDGIIANGDFELQTLLEDFRY